MEVIGPLTLLVWFIVSSHETQAKACPKGGAHDEVCKCLKRVVKNYCLPIATA